MSTMLPPSSCKLPQYQTVVDAITSLGLPVSVSELHGVMCGCIAAGRAVEGETYLRSWLHDLTSDRSQIVHLAFFHILTVTQQQIISSDFELQFLLPDDEAPLQERAQAFSEWCAGFIQGLWIARLEWHALDDEELQEAIGHLEEFSDLDYESLKIEEQDERALSDLIEYARVSVCHLFLDVYKNREGDVTQHAKH